MSNADLILLLGIGVAVTALALLIPAIPRGDPGVARPAAWWVPTVMAVAGAALGVVAVLVVAFR